MHADPRRSRRRRDQGRAPGAGRHPGGDDTRGWGPPFLRDASGAETAEAAYYLGTNRNKRSVTIDIATDEGAELVRTLAESADVLVENFKVGDMARRGLDAATLLARNPRLVYCSITGFGQTGPYRERAGYDYAVQGMGGLMSVTGPSRAEIADDAPGGGPQKVGVAVADLFTGMYAATAILAALRHRDRTGQGQAIDMALLDTQVAMLANLGAGYLASGVAPGRAGNAHQSIVPYQVFKVADGHVILAVGNDAQFARFCAVAGCPSSPPTSASPATPAGFATATTSCRCWRRACCGGRGRLAGRAGGGEGPCGPINDLAEVFADPQVRERAHDGRDGASARRHGARWSPARSSWRRRRCATGVRRRCSATTPTTCWPNSASTRRGGRARAARRTAARSDADRVHGSRAETRTVNKLSHLPRLLSDYVWPAGHAAGWRLRERPSTLRGGPQRKERRCPRGRRLRQGIARAVPRRR